MAVTAAMIKELREITGAGMSACKEALVETDGNMEKAIEFLREKGLAAAAKKAGRIAAEGIAAAYITDDNKKGVVVEVNSETDFVAKNPIFREYVDKVAEQAMETAAADIDAFLAEPWKFGNGETVAEALSGQIAVIGEKLSIRRFEKMDKAGSGKLVSYIHGGGRIAVMVELLCDKEDDALIELGKNLAMQIAALNPKFISKDDVPADFIEKETEILKTQALNDPKNANKPEKIINNMITGRLNKELKEFCLIEQPYVKDGDMTVKQYVESVAKEVGAPITVKRMIRFETGEGIEKRNENFADEVNKAING